MVIALCHTDEIPEGGARGFDLPGARLLAVKKRGSIYLYLNRCPHLGLPLDWEPDGFLDTEGLYIKCANHGAFFTIESGECIQGPCRGDALWPVTCTVADGRVLIPEEELPAAPGPA